MRKKILLISLFCTSISLIYSTDHRGKNDDYIDALSQAKPALQHSEKTMFTVKNDVVIKQRGIDNYTFEIPNNPGTLSNFKIRVFLTEKRALDTFIYHSLQNIKGADVPKKFYDSTDFVEVAEHADNRAPYPAYPELDKLYVMLSCDYKKPNEKNERITSLPVEFKLKEKTVSKKIGIFFKGIKSIDFETEKQLVSPVGTKFFLKNQTIHPNLEFTISSTDEFTF